MTRPTRYTENNSSRDWIDEFCATSTPEEVRGAFRFTIGKYLRRYGKKDDRLQEALKIQDYANRLVEYERSLVKPVIRELYTEADEKRMDIIGPNGNDGIHYRALTLPEDVTTPESAHFIVVYENGRMVAHDLKPVLVQGCWQAAAGRRYIGLGDGSRAGLYERMPGDIWVRVAD